MDPLTVSAQFSAYVWYSDGKPDSPALRSRANRFAQANWQAFLPIAHEGIGRLLMRLAEDRDEEPRHVNGPSTVRERSHEQVFAAC